MQPCLHRETVVVEGDPGDPAGGHERMSSGSPVSSAGSATSKIAEM